MIDDGVGFMGITELEGLGRVVDVGGQVEPEQKVVVVVQSLLRSLRGRNRYGGTLLRWKIGNILDR